MFFYILIGTQLEISKKKILEKFTGRWKFNTLQREGLSESESHFAQLCLTCCDPMDYTVLRILLARILKWVALPFSRGSSQTRDRTQLSHTAGRFFTNWATREAQEQWSGQPIPSPRDLPDTETISVSSVARGFFINWESLKRNFKIFWDETEI